MRSEIVLEQLSAIREGWVDPRKLDPNNYARYTYVVSLGLVRKLSGALAPLSGEDYCIGLSGSFARGEGGPRSDLDLVCVDKDGLHKKPELKTEGVDYVKTSLVDVDRYRTPEKVGDDLFRGRTIRLEHTKAIWLVSLAGDRRLAEEYADEMALNFNKYNSEFEEHLVRNKKLFEELAQNNSQLDSGIATYIGDANIEGFKPALLFTDSTLGHAVLKEVRRGFKLSSLVSNIPLDLRRRLDVLRALGLVELSDQSADDLIRIHRSLLRLYHTSQYVYSTTGETETPFDKEEIKSSIKDLISLCREI